MLKDRSYTPELNHHSLQGRRSRALAQALPALNKERNRSSQAGGFTIIEVVLVLAIAGLIFLMVFVALPALQRSQRDTARRQDVGQVLAALNNYRSNNKGRFPDIIVNGSTVPGDATWAGNGCRIYNYSKQLKPYYEDILSSETVSVCIIDQIHTGSDGGLSVGYGHAKVDSTIGLVIKAYCDDTTQRIVYGNKSVAAAVVRLEGGGYYCQDA